MKPFSEPGGSSVGKKSEKSLSAIRRKAGCGAGFKKIRAKIHNKRKAKKRKKGTKR